MKAALIDAHPGEGGFSSWVLEELERRLGEGIEPVRLRIRTPGIDGGSLAKLSGCGAWIFAFPVMMDAPPAHLLHCLMILERFFGLCPHEPVAVYVLADGDLYEGAQAQTALEIMKNWCRRATLGWGCGVGVGASGLLASPPVKGMARALSAALDDMALRIAAAEGNLPDRYVTASVPRPVYLLAVRTKQRPRRRPRRGLWGAADRQDGEEEQ